MESAGGTPGSAVSVPVNVDDIAQTLGSISLNISFDDARLTYSGYTANQLSGWVVSNLSGGLLNFEWNGSCNSSYRWCIC
ncbi:MAG: cohesin domain-containing protein [Bacteroidota bacterium]|nr:cohesin domain-containing protein [Bacteroidota bacterium]